MIKRAITLALVLLLCGTISYAQKTTEGGMYYGSNDEKATELFDKATAYGQNGDLDNAKKYYLKAIKADPNFVEAYDNVGLVYRKMGKLDKAIEYYQKSIKLFPSGEMAHQNLAVVYIKQGKIEKAIEEYNALLKISDGDPEGYFGIANCYLQINKLDEALENAMKALNIYKKTESHHLADGYYMVGMIYYYKEDNESSKEYLLEAKKLGAQIHPQLEEEVLGDDAEVSKEQGGEEEEKYVFETEEDYANAEQDIIAAHDWLVETPVGENTVKRKDLHGFVILWATGSPNVTIELSLDITPYSDCGECLIVYFAGYCNYCLETRDFDDKVKANMAATESVIKFYTKNKDVLGKNKDIEKLIKKKEAGELESFIKSKL